MTKDQLKAFVDAVFFVAESKIPAGHSAVGSLAKAALETARQLFDEAGIDALWNLLQKRGLV